MTHDESMTPEQLKALGCLEVAYLALQAKFADLTQERDRLREALHRTKEYIRTAMRPISVKEACGETSWDRAQRSGLQHALNAINAEFSKVEEPPPAPRGEVTDHVTARALIQTWQAEDAISPEADVIVAPAVIPPLASTSSRGEVIPACPQCKQMGHIDHAEDLETHEFSWICRICDSGFVTPAYYQRLSGPEKETP